MKDGGFGGADSGVCGQDYSVVWGAAEEYRGTGIGRQMLRSGTLVGAQYREAKRARSDAEFISKLEGGLQELEKTRYWMELLGDAAIMDWSKPASLVEEADGLTRILVTIVKQRKQVKG